MRKKLLLLPGLMLLCGFAVPPIEVSLVPAANAARTKALAACAARTDFKTNADVIDCTVAADRDFARTVKLDDPRLADDYAAKVKQLETDIGAGTVPPADISTRFHALQTGFFKSITDRYTAYQAEAAQDMARQSQEDASRALMQQKNNNMDPMNNMGGMSGMGN